MTYIQLVNSVLSRLRESTVTTVATTTYATLIGKFVNDAKSAVEDAWDWDALNTTLTVTTSASTSNYVVTGVGRRFKNVTINDITNDFQLHNVPAQWIRDQQQLSTVQTGNPVYYAWNGTNGTDSKIELFPTPNGTYTLYVNAYVPQADLSADADVLTMQSDVVIAGAYARALVERGEDGGLDSSEAQGIYKRILADQIAIEASRQNENAQWVAV